MEITWKVISVGVGGGRGRMGEKVQGLKSIFGKYKIGGMLNAKNSIENGEA